MNFATSTELSENKATERPNGCIVYSQHCILLSPSLVTLGYEKASTYTHSVGLDVARFDNSGNAKALLSGTSDRTWLHVFLCMYICDK